MRHVVLRKYRDRVESPDESAAGEIKIGDGDTMLAKGVRLDALRQLNFAPSTV